MIDWLMGIYMSFAQKYERFMKHEQGIAQRVEMDMEAIRKLKRGTRYVDGDFEPEMPDKEENDKTIGGIDSDKDGVRDDVEIWINYELDTPMKRKALKAMAFDDYSFISTTNNTEKNLRRIQDAGMISGFCFNVQYPRDDIYDNPAPKKNHLYFASGIEYLISQSTSARLSTYTTRGTMLSGTPGLQGYDGGDTISSCDALAYRYDPEKFSKESEASYQKRIKSNEVRNENR